MRPPNPLTGVPLASTRRQFLVGLDFSFRPSGCVAIGLVLALQSGDLALHVREGLGCLGGQLYRPIGPNLFVRRRKLGVT